MNDKMSENLDLQIWGILPPIAMYILHNQLDQLQKI